MYTEFLALAAFFLTLILALVSWGFQISVARKLKKVEIDPGLQIDKRSWITPVVMGWKRFDELAIRTRMIIWSVILGLTIIGVVATALLFISIYQPS